MSDCVFCRIALGEIPARLAGRSETAVAFHDLNPQAPVHVLVIPKREIARLADAGAGDQALLGHLMLAANEVARQLGVDDAFRLVVNNGARAGQSVFHLHLHVLAGRPMHWPPG